MNILRRLTKYSIYLLILPFGLIISTIYFIGSIPDSQQFNKKTNPNIIHIAIPKEKDINLLQKIEKMFDNTIPSFNEFNKVDQMIVNLDTNSFYIFKINEDVSEAFEQESTVMASNGVKHITINLHSPGGDVEAAYFIKEQIKILNEKGITVTTFIDNYDACMSACPLIFLAGNERIAYSSSVIMLHGPYITFPYNVPENVMNQLMRELRRDKEEFAIVLRQYCVNNPDIVEDLFNHHDNYYTAQKLKEKCGDSFFTELRPATKKTIR